MIISRDAPRDDLLQGIVDDSFKLSATPATRRGRNVDTYVLHGLVPRTGPWFQRCMRLRKPLGEHRTHSERTATPSRPIASDLPL